jgi:hypothetical protein
VIETCVEMGRSTDDHRIWTTTRPFVKIKRLEVGDVFFIVAPWHHDRSFSVVMTESGGRGSETDAVTRQDVTHSLRETS